MTDVILRSLLWESDDQLSPSTIDTFVLCIFVEENQICALCTLCECDRRLACTGQVQLSKGWTYSPNDGDIGAQVKVDIGVSCT